MVAGALMVRAERGGSGGLGQAGPTPQLVCVTELRSVCEALESADVDVTVEEAGATAAAVASTETPPADGWLTLGRWQDLAAEARIRAGRPALPDAPSPPLARSPLVMVAARERAVRLERHCDDGLTWRCVGENAGLPWREIGGDPAWGTLKPGYAHPADNATGLLVLGAAAADFLGDSDYSARDLEGDEFLAWLAQLEQGAGGHGTPSNTPLAQQLQFGPGRFDVVGTTEAEAGPLLERSAQRAQEFVIRYPDPLPVADVVLAQLREGDSAQRLRDLVNEAAGGALAKAGWRVAEQERAAGIPATPPLPPRSNLPKPGVLDALRVRWEEVAR